MDTKLLTYAEMASALGITPASAKRLANRHKWRKTIGNDGLSRVHVPVERLEVTRDTTGDDAEDAPSVVAEDAPDAAPRDDHGDARSLIAFLEAHVADLGTRTVRLENEVEILRPRAAQADILAAQLDAERQRIAEMVERAKQAQADRDRVQAERDRLLERVLDRPAPSPATGILGRLRKALLGDGH